MRDDLTGLRLSELYEFDNRAALDAVVRAICLECDYGYIEGLRALEVWAGAAAQRNAGARPSRAEDMPVYAIIDAGPITLDRFEADLREIGGRQERSERAIMLDRDLPPEPEGEVREGKVMLDDGADVARLLTDEYEIERDWQRTRALEIADFMDPDEGRERFEETRRLYLEAGQDLVGTLEYEQRETELAHGRAQADRAQAARERHEAERRAKARRLRSDGASR